GLMDLKKAEADDAVLTLRYYEALAKVADGKATKIIIPSDMSKLASLAAGIKEVITDKKE
ncbi:MAG: peptidase, partial [Bacilli bacterium]|nr:peptidase [Bacilli bacterium]